MLWSTQQTFDVSTTSEWRLTLTLDWRCRKVENESFLDVGFWSDWSRPKINLIPTSLQRRIGRDQKSTWFQRLYNVVCLLGSDFSNKYHLVVRDTDCPNFLCCATYIKNDNSSLIIGCGIYFCDIWIILLFLLTGERLFEYSTMTGRKYYIGVKI